MTPWTAAHQDPPSVGFSRQECWSGVPLPSLTFIKIMKIIAKPVIERLFTLNSPSNIRKWAHNIPLLQLLYFPLTLKIKGEHLNVECNPLVFEYCSFQWLCFLPLPFLRRCKPTMLKLVISKSTPCSYLSYMFYHILPS